MDWEPINVLDNPFLHDLTPEQYDLLSPLFHQICVPPRVYICKQGDKAIFMFLLQRGNVAVRYKPYDGPKITLTHLHTGDVFGWSAVVGNEAYTSDAISTTEVQVLQADGAALRKLCAEYPTAGRSILEKLAKAVSPRWIHAQRQIRSLLGAEVFSQV